jgi:hypothetical protein
MAARGPEQAANGLIAGTQTTINDTKGRTPMDEHRTTDAGDVLPVIDGPDGRTLDDAAVASGYATTTAPDKAKLERYLAAIEAERANYERAGNASGVADCDREIAATRARLS